MMNYKTSLITTVFILFCSLFAQAQNGLNYTEKQFNASDISHLFAQTSGGAIEVEGTNMSKASVQIVLRSSGVRKLKDAELTRIFEEDYTLNLSLNRGKLTVQAKPKKQLRRNRISVSLKISVPNKVNSELQTSGGSIRLANLTGKQVFQTAGGSLRLSNLSGSIDGQTSGGSIRLSQGDGDYQLQTSGGSIRVSDIKGNLYAHTSGGSIRLEHVQATIDVQTSGGSIRFDDCRGDMKAITSGGSISLDLPKDGYTVDLSGSRVSLPEGSFQGNTSKQAAKGSLNGGGFKVVAHTSAGSVNVDWL